jgi:WD40 repeat protein
MSSNRKRSHSSGQTALLLSSVAALGLFTFVACTRDLMIGASTRDLHPGQLAMDATGGTTGSGGAGTCPGGTVGTGGVTNPGTGGIAVTVPTCPTISTTPGTLNACGRTTGIAYSPDGQLVATATQTQRPNIHVWRLSDGALVRDIEGHDGVSYSVAFSPDGTILATAGAASGPIGCGVSSTANSGLVRLWDVATGNLLREIPAATGDYADAAQFSHDGTRLVTGGEFGPVRVWSVADGTLLATIPASYTTYTARFSPDDTRIVNAGSGSGAVSLSADGSAVFPLTGLEDEMNDAAYSPDGSQILTTGNHENLQIFDAKGVLLQSIPAQAQPYFSHAAWIDGNNIVSDDWSGGVNSWTRNAAGSFVASSSWSLGSQALGIAVSPDRTRLAVGADAGFFFLAYPPNAPAAIIPVN